MLPSALQHFPEIELQLLAHSRCALFLDFDGTLAPIVAHPADAQLVPEMRPLLRELNQLPGVCVAIVSGRALADLQARVGLNSLIYAGNHGLEIEGHGLQFVEPNAAALSGEVQELVTVLRKSLADIPGIVIEPKGLTVSIHYREVTNDAIPTIREALEQCISGVGRAFVIQRGKKVFELHPRQTWNKAHAAHWILNHDAQADALAVCVGDDTTDEDLFREFPSGITARVGATDETAARYSLNDCAEVQFLLRQILRVCASREMASST